MVLLSYLHPVPPLKLDPPFALMLTPTLSRCEAPTNVTGGHDQKEMKGDQIISKSINLLDEKGISLCLNPCKIEVEQLTHAYLLAVY